MATKISDATVNRNAKEKFQIGMKRHYYPISVTIANVLRLMPTFIVSLTTLWVTTLSLTTLPLTVLSLTTRSATAQPSDREGKIQLDMVNTMIDESDNVLSTGVLSRLDADPNFGGELDDFEDAATTLMDPYTPVSRGGYFPENAGVPLDQQLTLDECVYRLFQLSNGNELMIYQSPRQERVRYLIRGASD